MLLLRGPGERRRRSRCVRARAARPPGAATSAVPVRAARGWMSGGYAANRLLALARRDAATSVTRLTRCVSSQPSSRALLLAGVRRQVVLVEVVGQVARIDPEQSRRLLAHAARATLRLEQQLALQPVERLAQVELAVAGRGGARERQRRRPPARGRAIPARGPGRGSSPARWRCAARARCPASGRRASRASATGGSSGASRPRRAAISLAKWRGERRDVLLALAQRRHRDPHHVQPIEEVGAEVALLHLGLEVAVGRRPRRARRRASPARRPAARTRRPGRRAAAWPVPPRGIAPTSSSSSVPLVGELEAAVAVGLRPGEGALAVAEELALPDLERDGGAVHLDERPRGAPRQRVQPPRQQLLAGARLARQQHPGVGRRRRLDHRQHALPGRALADRGLGRRRDALRR